MSDEISELKIEIEQCFESKDYINRDLKGMINILINLINSDIINIEDEKDDKKRVKIEIIINDISEYLYSIKNIEILWKDFNFWLTNSIFFLNFWEIIQYFEMDTSIKIKYEFDEIWTEIESQIAKWKTDFKLEFVLTMCFLIFKEKKEILTYLEALKLKLKNTKEVVCIENLINFISSGKFDISLVKLFENDIEIALSFTIILLKFGKKFELEIANNYLNSKVNEIWEIILRLRNQPEISAFIRDWLCLRLLQIQVKKKLSTFKSYIVDELDFFSLSPRNFERLLFWIFKKKKGWKEIQWRGAGGSEKGKDLLAIKKKSERNWIIQAKREKNFSRSNFEQEFDKVLGELKYFDCEGYQIFLAKNATEDVFKCGEELAKEYKYQIKVKDREEINFIVKQEPILLKEFFNYPI